jgi:membrane associated rhomboid family serine protease
MIAGRHSEDYHPITWVGRFPIYVTTLLVAAHVLAMVGTAVALSISGAPAAVLSPLLRPLVFSATDVLTEYSVWQFVTYAFVNEPSVWFAIEMLLLYSFGREIERFLGRKSFLFLYAGLVLAGPVALTLLGLLQVPSGMLVGAGAVHFAVFIAFATLYPGAEMMFFRVQIKWVAVVLLAIYSLAYLAGRDWTNLGVLWLECACAVLMMRRAGVASVQFDMWLPPDRDEESPRPARKKQRPAALPEPDLHDSIDPLLEKISRHGIGSLTKRERERLEQARTDLLEREKRR